MALPPVDTGSLTSLTFVSSRIPKYVSSPETDAKLSGYVAEATAWFLAQTGRTLVEYGANVPADVQGAVADWAIILGSHGEHPGVMSREVSGAVVQYQTLTVPVHVQSVVDAHRNFRGYFGRSA